MEGSTELADYTFDLQGFLELKGALSAAEVAALNAELDAIPADLENQQWHGHVHRQDYQRPESEGGEGYRKGHPGAKGENGDVDAQDWGINLQNIIEAGPAFESLIDHPSWLAHVRRFIGGGNPYIDECFCTIRDGQGAGSPLHSGAHKRNLKTQFRYHDGAFRCGEINILIALDDCGPGDGATLVVPGSHKSNLIHPAMEHGGGHIDYTNPHPDAAHAYSKAVEVFQEAGDALLFVDCTVHGSAPRTTKVGRRRFVVYRYGPGMLTRYNYQPSVGLLKRLTPQRRRIIQHYAPPLMPPGEVQEVSEATGAVSTGRGFGPEPLRDLAKL